MKLGFRSTVSSRQKCFSYYVRGRYCLIRNNPHWSRQFSITAPLLRNRPNFRKKKQNAQESSQPLDWPKELEKDRREGNEAEETELAEMMFMQLKPLPSFAPAPVIDVRHIRQNPGLHKHNCTIRRYDQKNDYPQLIVDLSARLVALQEAVRTVREQRNVVKRQIADAANDVKSVKIHALEEAEKRLNVGGEKDLSCSDLGHRSFDEKPGPDAMESLIAKARRLSEDIGKTKAEEQLIQRRISWMACRLPNLTSERTPDETAELIGMIDANSKTSSMLTSEMRTKLQSTAENCVWPSHVEIGSKLGILDFAAAATTSGWGWYYFVNEAVMLEQALVQYALSIGRQRGWNVVSPPSIVYNYIAAACGYEPRTTKGEQQIYTLQRPEKDDGKSFHSLAGTSEISLAGMKAKQMLEEADLPLKMMGVSRCYRAEAGARGVATKGLYRVHEFTKVELFAWTMPDDRSKENFGSKYYSYSDALFDEIMGIQHEILQSLGLQCRILEMPAKDLGASASRKRDIEAFFPSRLKKNEGWGEVTSTSNCTDYQSRRLGTRVKTKPPNEQLVWPHTVNGTAVAIPRVLAAILENGWDEQRMAVRIPEVLRPWMGGKAYIDGKK